MSEPLEMTLDFGPYIRLLQRRPEPEKMSDDELAKQLKKVRRLPDNTRAYAGTVAMMMFMGCPAIGYTAMALGAASPALWMIGAGIVMWQAGKRALPMVARRAHADMALLETEIKHREIDRAARTAVEKMQAAAKKAEQAELIAKRAQEAFERAIGSGLPLEKKISVSKSIKFKPAAAREKI